MDEYINKRALLFAANDTQSGLFPSSEDPPNVQYRDQERWIGAETIINLIESFPTTNAKPVMRGRNVATEYSDTDQFVCSGCGIELQGWAEIERDDESDDVTEHEYVFKFCPECGADVRPSREQMKIGTKVVMVNCREAEKYSGKVWTTLSEPWECCGAELVLLEGYFGGFAVNCLKVVEEEYESISNKT